MNNEYEYPDAKVPLPGVYKPQHKSLEHSRPECNDIGSQTIKFDQRVSVPENRRRSPLPRLLALLAGGVLLLLVDGSAIVHYADSVIEATVFSLLTMPAATFLIMVALTIADLNEADSDLY